MPQRHTTLTGAAGEHYVAFALSVRGYVAALTRGGTPFIDILCSSADGKRTLAIQVKTMSYAFHGRKRKPENSHWAFDVGWKAVGNRDNSFLYAFVCLQGIGDGKPLVFIAPPSDIADALGDGYKRNMFWVMEKDRYHYEVENWKLIEDALGPSVLADTEEEETDPAQSLSLI